MIYEQCFQKAYSNFQISGQGERENGNDFDGQNREQNDGEEKKKCIPATSSIYVEAIRLYFTSISAV